MSYLRKFEYKIMPKKSYAIIRNCSGCGSKSIYDSTDDFRVNSNGNKIDVWLIYKCNKCKHTYNLAIFERKKTEHIPTCEYKGFIENNRELAMKYGTDKTLLVRNKAEFDGYSTGYTIIDQYTQEELSEGKEIFQVGDLIEIENPSQIKIRVDKLVAELLDLSRSKVKELEKNGNVAIQTTGPKEKIQIWV